TMGCKVFFRKVRSTNNVIKKLNIYINRYDVLFLSQYRLRFSEHRTFPCPFPTKKEGRIARKDRIQNRVSWQGIDIELIYGFRSNLRLEIFQFSTPVLPK